MKKLVLLLAATIVAFTGCSPVQENTDRNEDYGYRTFTAELPDGTTTQCVWLKSGYGGGLSCQ